MNTTLHIPVNKEIKEQAEEVVKGQGYSSLQEVIRVLVFSLAKGEMKTTVIPTQAKQILTSEQEKYLTTREEQTRKAIKYGKAHKVTSVNGMLHILEKPKKKHEH